MGAVVAVVNQKGGVGKTTITLGLASAAREAGARALVVDADPQASATWALGVEPVSGKGRGTAGALAANEGGAAGALVMTSGWGEAVSVLPAGPGLQARDADTEGKAPYRRLRRALRGVRERFDVVLVDCAPALGPLTTNALVAADLVLLAVEPAALSLRGVGAVSDLIDGVWEDLNPSLDIAGVIVNRVPPVSAEADRQIDYLARMLGRKTIWEPYVPQRVAIARALAERRPIHDAGPPAVAELFDALYDTLRRRAKDVRGARTGA